MLQEELNFFITHQHELVSQYQGQVLVIKGQQVVGTYPNILSAYLEGQKKYKLGTFLIQPCQPGPDAYTTTVAPYKVLLQ